MLIRTFILLQVLLSGGFGADGIDERVTLELRNTLLLPCDSGSRDGSQTYVVKTTLAITNNSRDDVIVFSKPELSSIRLSLAESKVSKSGASFVFSPEAFLPQPHIDIGPEETAPINEILGHFLLLEPRASFSMDRTYSITLPRSAAAKFEGLRASLRVQIGPTQEALILGHQRQMESHNIVLSRLESKPVELPVAPPEDSTRPCTRQ